MVDVWVGRREGGGTALPRVLQPFADHKFTQSHCRVFRSVAVVRDGETDSKTDVRTRRTGISKAPWKDESKVEEPALGEREASHPKAAGAQVGRAEATLRRQTRAAAVMSCRQVKMKTVTRFI